MSDPLDEIAAVVGYERPNVKVPAIDLPDSPLVDYIAGILYRNGVSELMCTPVAVRVIQEVRRAVKAEQLSV